MALVVWVNLGFLKFGKENCWFGFLALGVLLFLEKIIPNNFGKPLLK